MPFQNHFQKSGRIRRYSENQSSDNRVDEISLDPCKTEKIIDKNVNDENRTNTLDVPKRSHRFRYGSCDFNYDKAEIPKYLEQSVDTYTIIQDVGAKFSTEEIDPLGDSSPLPACLNERISQMLQSLSMNPDKNHVVAKQIIDATIQWQRNFQLENQPSHSKGDLFESWKLTKQLNIVKNAPKISNSSNANSNSPTSPLIQSYSSQTSPYINKEFCKNSNDSEDSKEQSLEIPSPEQYSSSIGSQCVFLSESSNHTNEGMFDCDGAITTGTVDVSDSKEVNIERVVELIKREIRKQYSKSERVITTIKEIQCKVDSLKKNEGLTVENYIRSKAIAVYLNNIKHQSARIHYIGEFITFLQDIKSDLENCIDDQHSP